jgi:hypothetical protein
MTQSNWEILRQRSQYHFDTEKWNPKWDRVEHVGRIEPSWSQELEKAIAQAQAVTWRTRGKTDDPLKRQDAEYDQEDYDLEQQGYSKDHVVSDLTYELAPVFQKIADQFALEKSMARIHVQRPGQTWNLHLDKLEKWMPADPSQVVRYFVQLTDWQPGHFWAFGNYTWSRWQAGDIGTSDWYHVPHATANAGHRPRVTLQITGVATDATKIFLQQLASNKSIKI